MSRAHLSETYSKAVAELVVIAGDDTSGSKAAAQVLLSAWNGYDFQVSIPDLSLLDAEHYNAAITVMHGRCVLGVEPHEAINNGKEIFQRLYNQWQHLKVTERANQA